MAIIRPVFNWVAQPGITPPAVNFTRASTATYTDALGVIRTATSGVLRDSFDPLTGAYLGKLIEEQRTNLLAYSSVFDNAAWTQLNGPVIAPGAAVSPDGTQTAYSVGDTSTAYTQTIKQDLTVPANTSTYCASLYVQKTPGGGPITNFNLYFFNGTQANYRLEVNTATGECHTNTAYAGSAAPAGFGVIDCGQYWRLWVAGANKGDSTSLRFGLTPSYGLGWNQPLSDVLQTKTLAIWGAQLEEGAFPTSYIPTTSAPVTRSADQCTLPLASLADSGGNPAFGMACGTMFANFAFNGLRTDVVGQAVIGLDDGTTANRINISRTLASGLFTWDKVFGVQVGAVQILHPSPAAGTHYRAAYGFDSAGRSSCLNGGGVLTDATPIAPVATTLNIGSLANGSFLNGVVRHAALFARRFSDADLQALTA
ncbi:phage head spike fiber domain-containing protein [Fundidesulfovibrio agrisoli]|uniref:phage head spike fiber domain-containing protein n=1 Tax=Fundidesulfovibrio agrisoli TaxID=2922717 RepID=UPI001FABBA30|nr:hypothetical protein [Fundidesulfovibrio agrisoli]